MRVPVVLMQVPNSNWIHPRSHLARFGYACQQPCVLLFAAGRWQRLVDTRACEGASCSDSSLLSRAETANVTSESTEVMDDHNVHHFWGLSPAIDLLDLIEQEPDQPPAQVSLLQVL